MIHASIFSTVWKSKFDANLTPASYAGCSRHGLNLPYPRWPANNWTYPLYLPFKFLGRVIDGHVGGVSN
jgi:hypothetical protein